MKIMARFRIDWLESGLTEILEQSDRDDVDGYIACRFGDNYSDKVAKVTKVADNTEQGVFDTAALTKAPAPKVAPKVADTAPETPQTTDETAQPASN
jgi:hypothetical protein